MEVAMIERLVFWTLVVVLMGATVGEAVLNVVGG